MYSSQTLVSDGTVTRVDLSIEYLSKEDIQVFVDDTLLPTNGYAWTWASDTAINFNQPVRLGSVINIRRTTAYDNIKHIFEVGGAVFKDHNVDENFRQVLYWCQDFIEGKSINDVWNDLNIHGFRITNLGTATDSFDAVSLGQYQADAMGAWIAKRETELLKEAAFDKLNTTQGYSDAMKLVLESDDIDLNVPFPDGSSIPTVAKRTIDLTSAVTSVNGQIGNVVLGEAANFKGTTVVRTVPDTAQLPDAATSTLCVVKAPNDLGSGITYKSDGANWVELKRLLNPYDFGATYSGDNTSAITLANTYANTAQVQIELPTNTLFEVDNCDINTANFVGAGKLIFKNHNRTMLPKYRKGHGGSDIITLEDEYGSHIDSANRYSGFGCSVLMSGAEWVVSRTAKNRDYNAGIPSSLVLYKINRNKDNQTTKYTLITETAGRDIRDVNASIFPTQPSRCLIKYALQTSANTFEGRLLSYDASTGIISNRKLLVPANQCVWGNTLITPLGYLLTASYGLDGSVILYRSNAVFSIDDTSDIAMTQVAQFESNGAVEPTIAYYKDVLFIIWRKSVGTVGKYATTYNTEGLGGWGVNLNAPLEVHAPYIDPYNIGKDELFIMFSLGNDRSILATMASQNLVTWYTTATVLCAGNTALATGQSGGYPSFVDYGDNISVQSYADFRHSDMTLTSRLDVRMLKKQTFSAKNNIAACLEEYFDSTLEWGEYGLGTSATTIDISVVFKRDLGIKNVVLRMSGTSNNTHVELINSTGMIVATTNKPSISATYSTPITFTFPSSVAVSAAPYTVRIQRRDTANLHVFNWANNKLRAPRVINNRTYNITNLTSASSSTLWDNTGIHVSLY